MTLTSIHIFFWCSVKEASFSPFWCLHCYQTNRRIRHSGKRLPKLCQMSYICKTIAYLSKEGERIRGKLFNSKQILLAWCKIGLNPFFMDCNLPCILIRYSMYLKSKCKLKEQKKEYSVEIAKILYHILVRESNGFN